MEKGQKGLLMAIFTKANISLGNLMARVIINGLMVTNIEEILKMVREMDLEYGRILKKMNNMKEIINTIKKKDLAY